MSSKHLHMFGWTKQKVLGKGSFGEAWLLKRLDSSDNQRSLPNSSKVSSLPDQAVCKVVNLSGMKTREREEAFKEAQLLGQLRHPNIVRQLGNFEGDSKLHIILEYCDGGDLEQLIKAQRGKPLEQEVVIQLFLQLCSAVRYLHGRRTLHRDLKAQNVFLTTCRKTGKLIVKLGDFGISTVLRHTCALAKTVCGTPYYFSPELCLNKPYNNKSDVWSLGCILYELCTLRHAFDATSMKGLMQRIINGTYTPLSTKHYSPELNVLVGHMLSTDVKKRFNIHQVLEFPVIKSSIQLFRQQYLDEAGRDALNATISSGHHTGAVVEALSGVVQPSQSSSDVQVNLPEGKSGRVMKLGRKPSAKGKQDTKLEVARERREAMQQQLEARQKQLEQRRRERDSKMVKQRRAELDHLREVRAKVEQEMESQRGEFLAEGRRVVDETRERQHERERQAEAREKHLEELKAQMEAVDSKMNRNPNRGDFGGGRRPSALQQRARPPMPQAKEPTAAELAKFYRHRVSEEAPWNRGRERPVGFTQDEWNEYCRIKAYAEEHDAPLQDPAGIGGRPDEVGEITLRGFARGRQVAPDQQYGGMRSVQTGVDVDRILQGYGKVESAEEENDGSAQLFGGGKDAQLAAELWRKRQAAIRQASGVGTTGQPVVGQLRRRSEAELLWEERRRQIRNEVEPEEPSVARRASHGPESVVSRATDVITSADFRPPPQQQRQQSSNYADDFECPTSDTDDDVPQVGEMNRPNTETPGDFDRVILHVARTPDRFNVHVDGEPDEADDFFEEEELPANEVSKLANVVKFRLDGRTLHLPNVDQDDPLQLRVEALRLYLVEALGEKQFEFVYEVLRDIQTNSSMSDDTAEDLMEGVMRQCAHKAAYVPLVTQLCVCERSLQ